MIQTKTSLEACSLNIPRKAWLAMALVFIILQASYYSFTLEDAQITYRYALRLSEGYAFGMWNRVGEPVEGYTSLLWTAYLSLFNGVNAIAHASKITSIFAVIMLVAFMIHLSNRHRPGQQLAVDVFGAHRQVASNAFLCCAAATAIHPPFIWYSTTGMETTLFATFLFMAVFAPLVISASWVLALMHICLILLRPEGILISMCSSASYFILTKERRFLLLMAISAMTIGLLTTARLVYFGYPMPNTYYAKAGASGLYHVKEGFNYILNFCISYWYLCLPVAISMLVLLRHPKGALREHRFALALILTACVHAAAVVKAGGDNAAPFPMWRHMQHMLPVILFLTFTAAFWLAPKWMQRGGWALFLAALLIQPFVGGLPRSQVMPLPDFKRYAAYGWQDLLSNHYEHSKMTAWIKGHVNANTVVATSVGGEIPLHVDAIHIDTLGLNDVHIAHKGTFDPAGPTDSKSDMGDVIARRPDLIEAYMKATELLSGDPDRIRRTVHGTRAMMNLALLQNPDFKRDYLMVVNAPYDDLDRILFVRRDQIQHLKAGGALQTMPLDTLISAVGA